MSYQDKLDGALALVKEHNLSFIPEGSTFDGPPPEGHIDIVKFTNCIKFKARNEDALNGLKYEQILECLPTCFGTKPDSLAKDIAKVFRDKEEITLKSNDPADEGGRLVKNKEAADMSWRKLIANFDPTDLESPITKRLASIANTRPFIVYSKGREVDSEATLKLFMGLKNNGEVRDFYLDKEVFAIGNLPERYADENPLYPNRPLRSDGTCDQTNRSWEGVSQPVRQLIYLAIKDGTINVNVDNGILVANSILDLALSADADKKLRERFPKTSVQFNKLVNLDQLPKLKIELGKAKPVKPFHQGQKVQWEQRADNFMARSPR